MSDKEEIVRALTLWFQPGDVFEIRALGATTGMNTRPHTESGYFDFEHAAEAADAIGKIRSADGVYVTINPVKRDLLARAVYKLRFGKDLQTTADGNIVRRRWMLVDCDPVRESGIASTDAEHDLAIGKAKEIRDGLASLGWPTPILSDSGNGAHLFYRVDLPADDGGLVQNALAVLHTASDEHVEVDVSVFNPARIVRVPGTMNRKGDDTDGKVCGRPHRMAKILEVPERIDAVAEEQLKVLVGSKPVAPPQPIIDDKVYYESGDFSIDEWIAKFAPDAGSPIPYRNNGVSGRKWIFKVCPFNPEHNNSAAAILAFDGGGYTFKCLHNGCAGNDWKKFRVLREPGCYDRRPETYPDVDISGILNGNGKAAAANVPDEKDVAEDFSDPGKVKEKLLHIPGFVDELTDFSMSCAPKPNRVLSFCGALAFLSYIAGRNVTDERNNRPNIYLVALANSGVGKEQPRRINMAVATATDPGLCDGLADTFASGQGLEDALYVNPTMLFQLDEMDTLLNSLKAKDPRAEGLLGNMLRIYSASASAYKLRPLAVSRGDLSKMKEGKRNGRARGADVIHNPYLVIFGTAIPQLFYQALDQRLLTNGLSARCLIIEAGERGRKNRAKLISVPESIIRTVKVILSYGGQGNLTSMNPVPMTIEATPEADAMLDALDEKYDGIYDKYSKKNALVPMTFWARAFEKVCKLSQLYAISANAASPIIDADAVRWASRFVEFLTEQTLFLTHSYSYENPFDEKCQKALRYIREAGGEYRHGALLKRMHESADVFHKIIDTLKENESIKVEVDPAATTKNALVYRLR